MTEPRYPQRRLSLEEHAEIVKRHQEDVAAMQRRKAARLAEGRAELAKRYEPAKESPK